MSLVNARTLFLKKITGFVVCFDQFAGHQRTHCFTFFKLFSVSQTIPLQRIPGSVLLAQ
jgi:hypothetical protein